MPEITIQDMKQMLAHFAAHDGQMICRGHSERGHAGHPVIFPPDCFATLAAVTGDQGGRDILRQHAQRVVKVGLPADHAITDLDTPEAWEKWRQAQCKP
jgi:CTP:molybdopterin cytidylyltransferase MocA